MSELLIQDSTGVSIMDYQIITDLRGVFEYPQSKNKSFHEVYSPTEVLARMHAAEVYKIIYPLSE